jgi:hypothetical protein
LGIQDFVLDNDRSGPAHPALLALNMLVGTHEGQAYTLDEIRAMLEGAGARDVRTLNLNLPPGCRILLGTI